MAPRHSLAWLSAAGWAAAGVQVPAVHRAEVERWRAADWPLVVRQQESGRLPQTCCLGLALPPQLVGGIKHRLPLRIDAGEITRREPACTLLSVLPAVPPNWQGELMRLHRALTASGISAQVYGSVALQALTGLQYVRASSDIDLLLHPISPTQLEAALDHFDSFSRSLPLDGELVFPCGAAVALKEWRKAELGTISARVLVKRHGGVTLQRTEVLRASLERQRCMHSPV